MSKEERECCIKCDRCHIDCIRDIIQENEDINTSRTIRNCEAKLNLCEAKTNLCKLSSLINTCNKLYEEHDYIVELDSYYDIVFFIGNYIFETDESDKEFC